MNANTERLDSIAKRIRLQANNLRVDNFLSFLYTSEIFNRYLDIEMVGFSLNSTHMSILHNLIVHGGTMTPTELSGRILRSIHATARSLDRLDKLGLTRSMGTKHDRRLRKVSITEKGLDIVESTMPHRQNMCTQVMSCLSQEEAEAFRTLLRRIRKHVLHLIEKPETQ